MGQKPGAQRAGTRPRSQQCTLRRAWLHSTLNLGPAPTAVCPPPSAPGLRGTDSARSVSSPDASPAPASDTLHRLLPVTAILHHPKSPPGCFLPAHPCGAMQDGRWRQPPVSRLAVGDP